MFHFWQFLKGQAAAAEAASEKKHIKCANILTERE